MFASYGFRSGYLCSSSLTVAPMHYVPVAWLSFGLNVIIADDCRSFCVCSPCMAIVPDACVHAVWLSFGHHVITIDGFRS